MSCAFNTDKCMYSILLFELFSKDMIIIFLFYMISLIFISTRQFCNDTLLKSMFYSLSYNYLWLELATDSPIIVSPSSLMKW